MNLLKSITFILIAGFCTSILADKPTVIVLSWDGMRFDYPDLANYPGLQRLEHEGLRAQALVPVYPSSTFPTHISMATGAPPAIHGVMDNKFFDRNKGSYAYSNDADWIEAEPVWITAERQGVKAATFFWVGSETNWHDQGVSYRRAPFDESVPESEKVDQIIDWLDLPKAEKPHLIMSYWRGADSTAHEKGPDHSDVKDVLAKQDIQLQRLLSAIDKRELWPSTTFILVGDHGMAEISEVIDIKEILANTGINARVSGRGAVKHLFLEDMSDETELLVQLNKQPHIQVYKQKDIPTEFNFIHPTRTGDIIVTTEAPYVFAHIDSLLLKVKKIIAPLLGLKAGGHGYSPKNPKMSAVFFAMGRGVDPTQSLGKVQQLQLAPTITKLLGISPPLQAHADPIKLH